MSTAPVSNDDIALKIADLSHEEARAALLGLASSPHKKYRESARHALQMIGGTEGREFVNEVQEAWLIRERKRSS